MPRPRDDNSQQVKTKHTGMNDTGREQQASEQEKDKAENRHQPGTETVRQITGGDSGERTDPQ